MSIQVLRPGLLMTVQDMGRHGHQHVGLCPGGAMDPLSLALANALVGNYIHAAALELTVLGPDLLFERETLVALVGAEFEADIPINRPVLLERGARYVPALKDARIEGVRACARPLSADGRPLLGAIDDGVYLVTGHGAWGITLGPASSRRVADQLLGRRADIPPALSAGRIRKTSGSS